MFAGLDIYFEMFNIPIEQKVRLHEQHNKTGKGVFKRTDYQTYSMNCPLLLQYAIPCKLLEGNDDDNDNDDDAREMRKLRT